MVGEERQRLLLVDLGGGDVVAIVVDAPDPTRFDELVNAAMPVIGSMQFH